MASANGALDFYAKIEPSLDLYEAYDGLYEKYINHLQALHVKDVLDIGCGNGRFLQVLKQCGIQARGIDLSERMVQRAKALGVEASNEALEDFEDESITCAIAAGDVLNYMSKDALLNFFETLSKVLKNDGLFFFDINTLIGFEVASGVMKSEDEKHFLCVQSDFDEPEFITEFTLFSKQQDSYQKEQYSIKQYYHDIDFFKKLSNFQLVGMQMIGMFEEENEKALLILKKQ